MLARVLPVRRSLPVLPVRFSMKVSVSLPIWALLARPVVRFIFAPAEVAEMS